MQESKLRIAEKANGIVLTYFSLGSACEQKVLGPEGDLFTPETIEAMKFSCLQMGALVISDPFMVFC